MANSIPIVIIVIGVIMVLLALLVWRRRKEEKLEGISSKRKKAFYAQWIIGLVLALIAAVFMFDGDILGENTTGISTIMGIVGICLIATSNVTLLSLKRK
ncbi:MAG: LPXTG cell wall anchor domain-containing protein [Dehalococcoidia bacterium]|nr:LPXTG cell wall anchor domain-containing protein [Dehalococcoidia bacterium]